jgi:polysaccharide biosynthesis/export protein
LNYTKAGQTKCVLCLLSILLLGACGPAVHYPSSFILPQAHIYPQPQSFISETEYKIQPGDVLDIKLFYNPELNQNEVLVRPDGRISLQLIPEIMAAGLTPAELKMILKKEYDEASEFRNISVAVIVRSIAGQRVFVDGEVNRPNVYSLVGPMTPLQAIAIAGGARETARMNEVIVIRRGPDNKPIVTTVNMEAVISGDTQNQDILLMPYDIVYVPRSPIANINLWVSQYITRILPFSLPSPVPQPTTNARF